jgi:hypothetical protein
MITVTSLTHPTMIAKIQLAMKLAGTGQGHLMNGHGNRCYIQDRNGRNIMRLQYIDKRFTVYGDSSKDITKVVAKAIKQHYTTNLN